MMKEPVIKLLLADDDKDDCDLFREALTELALTTELVTVHDGEQLMQLLNNGSGLPGILFLDLNMPRKNGFECLSEIKEKDGLKDLPVVIFSTSFDHDIVHLLYNRGAHYYISKPNEFDKLKTVIQDVLHLMINNNSIKPGFENFVLQS